MPYTLKPYKLHAKDPNTGEYLPQNAITEDTTTEQVLAVTNAGTAQLTSIQSTGSAQITAVQNKGTEVLNSIPQDYSTLSSNVANLESAFEDQTNFYSSTSLIDFSTSNISWYIDANGLWQMNSAKRCGLYQVPSHACKLVVVANSTSIAAVAFLKSDTKTDDTSADFATGETGYHLIAAGETQTFYLPSDCTYIYVSKTNATTDDRVPESCTIYVRKEIPAVDTTLAISGAAADAKMVGDALAQYELDTEKSINLFDMQSANYGYYINTSGGGLVSRADHFYAYIPITDPGTYRYYNDSSMYGTTSAKKIVIYDSSKQYKTVISATHFGDGTGDWYGVEFTISAADITSGYAFFGVSQHVDNIQRFMVVKDIEYPSTYYPYFAEREVFDSLNTKMGHALGAVNNKLFGKTALFFGDSICNGSSADDNKYGWAGRIGLGNEMTWRNFGQNGATICTQSGRSSISTQVSNAISEFASPDYAIIEGGTNDADLNAIPIGTYTEGDYGGTYDTTTFSGAFETLIYNCLTNWPHAKIGYIVAQKMGRSADARAERKEFFDRAMAICTKWGIPYLNLWDNTPLNPMLDSMYDSTKTSAENIEAGSMYVDGQHLTPDGYDYLSPIIEHWMRGLYSETTTTVEDGSITKEKLSISLQNTVDDVADLKSAFSGLEETITSQFTFVDGKRIKASDGLYQSSTSLKATQSFVSIEKYSHLKIMMMILTTASSSGLAFYSSNNESSYISGVEPNVGEENGGALVTIQIPENAKYARTTYWADASLPEGAPAFECTGIYVGADERIATLEAESSENQKSKDDYKKVHSMRSAERVSVITNMQSGHGFTNPLSSGNEPVDDTTDYIYGTQSVKFNHAGQALISSTGIDLTGCVLYVTLKVDQISSNDDIKLYVSGSSTFSSEAHYTLYKSVASSHFETGVWGTVSVNVGSANQDVLKSVKYIRVRGSTTGVEFNIQSIGYRLRGTQKPCISFTFDDGWPECMDAAKILGKYCIPATAYIFQTSQLTLSQLKSLRFDYGWDIEMHGANTFTSETEEELVAELTALKEYIRSNGLGRGNHLAYPGGKNSRDVVDIVSRFCDTARTISNESSRVETIPSPMPYNLRAISSIGASGTSVANVKNYIDAAVATNSWLILVFHRIGDTATSMYCSASDLEEIADYAVKSGADIKTVEDMWERN